MEAKTKVEELAQKYMRIRLKCSRPFGHDDYLTALDYNMWMAQVVSSIHFYTDLKASANDKEKLAYTEHLMGLYSRYDELTQEYIHFQATCTSLKWLSKSRNRSDEPDPKGAVAFV